MKGMQTITTNDDEKMISELSRIQYISNIQIIPKRTIIE